MQPQRNHTILNRGQVPCGQKVTFRETQLLDNLALPQHPQTVHACTCYKEKADYAQQDSGIKTATNPAEANCRKALAEDPETVVISVDMGNAFNSIQGATNLAAVQQSGPALLPMVQWAYGDETLMHTVSPRRTL